MITPKDKTLAQVYAKYRKAEDERRNMRKELRILRSKMKDYRLWAKGLAENILAPLALGAGHPLLPLIDSYLKAAGSLIKREKPQPLGAAPNAPIKICPDCDRAHSSALRGCPCGHQFYIPKKGISAEILEQVDLRHSNGEPIPTIAADLGLNPSTLRGAMIKAGYRYKNLPVRVAIPKYPDELVVEWMRMIREGTSVKEISRAYPFMPETIYQAIYRYKRKMKKLNDLRAPIR